MKRRVYYSKKTEFPIIYRSEKIPGKCAICQSPIEYTIFQELDLDPEVKDYIPEPFRIPYEYRGKAHDYIPDILIRYTNSNQKLIEIKTLADVIMPRNKAKLTTAKIFCDSSNIEFEIWIRSVSDSRFVDKFPSPANFSCWEDANDVLEKFKKRIQFKRIIKNIFLTIYEIIKLTFGLVLWAIIIIFMVKAIFGI